MDKHKLPPTPYFVLDRKTLSDEVSSCKRAIARHWPNTLIAYSVKTNALPYLAKILHAQGVLAEVVSEDEYEMVGLCGYTPDRIVCNGPVKSHNFVERLMDSHVMTNLDSHAELLSVIAHAHAHPERRFKVGLRVNVDIEAHFPGESKAGEQGSRFGFCMDNDELTLAIAQLKQCPNIVIAGLHLHVSTSSRKVEIYQWLANLFALLVRQHQLRDIEYFDIGGGFFGGIPDKPGWDDYLSAIAETLTGNGFDSRQLTLILEPGVSLLAGAFSYYASVIDVKQTTRSRFVVTDGSRIHIDPFFHKTSYFYEHLADSLGATMEQQMVVGFTCLEYDNIMTLTGQPEVKVGDRFRFDKLGAYTISLSPLFISYFPAVYVRKEDGALSCVRRRWTAREFIQSSVL